MDFIDIKKAYFHAKSRRKVFVNLPKEDQDEGMCGMLMKSVYGTRDAAQNWEIEYAEFMVNAGFTRGMAVPCIFNHATRDLRIARSLGISGYPDLRGSPDLQGSPDPWVQGSPFRWCFFCTGK